MPCLVNILAFYELFKNLSSFCHNLVINVIYTKKYQNEKVLKNKYITTGVTYVNEQISFR